jgi:cytochrome c oxidase cbb3-type subunit 3
MRREALTSMRYARRALYGSFLIFGLLLSGPGISIAQQARRSRAAGKVDTSNANSDRARHDYETRCSSCHGLDGRGSEHAPNISTDPAIRTLPDRDIFRMVHDGIPSKGMPPFDHLTDAQIKSIVSYLRFMGRQTGWEFVNGNSLQGEELFFGKAGCSNCHMMSGKGGFVGADLTDYAGTHTPGEMREAILNPGKLRDPYHRTVTIVTREGKRLSGVARNEDNFSLQLLGVDGTFHLLLKSEVKNITRSEKPLMPEDYAQRLSPGEIEDLVAYLARETRRAVH